VKLLLDACVWGGSKQALSDLGHDVIWAGDWSEDPGDDAILSRANADGRILVTLDKDFGELAVIQARPHRGIIRLVGISARQQAATCQAVLTRHGENLLAGALATAESTRLRIRMPGDKD
jgi:predicted nuclease of predicted toxin-antitoxin system